MIYLCALLTLACAALAVALRRARRDVAGLRRRGTDTEIMVDALGQEINRLRAARTAPPVIYAGPVRAMPRARIFDRAPQCSACAGLVIGAEVARHMRVPATEIRGPITPTEAPRAFIVRRGQA